MRWLSGSAWRKAFGRAKKRRRVVSWWRTRTAGVAMVLVTVAATSAVGWWTWTTGRLEQSMDRIEASALSATADLGLAVAEVFVVGRRETPRHQVLTALGVARGSPILGLDITAARARLTALPWVRDASVERLLPETLVVRLDEREPLALWQNQGEFALIDHDGTVIARDDLSRFAHLIVVVGEDAPSHAAGLIALLDRQPRLRREVEAAVRVGGRRWNLRLQGGIDVRLPELDPEGAWARLAEYERRHDLLNRDVQVLDLRFSDQVIVRQNERSDPESTTKVRDPKGQET